MLARVHFILHRMTTAARGSVTCMAASPHWLLPLGVGALKLASPWGEKLPLGVADPMLVLGVAAKNLHLGVAAGKLYLGVAAQKLPSSEVLAH